MPDSSSLFSLGLVVSALIIFWSLSSTSSSPFARTFPQLHNKRICLLIAHPDDEAMFFAPTVLSLARPELGNHLKILCLSSGDADGLGHIRSKELQKSAKQLGLRSESDVLIIEDPSRFADGMNNTWAEGDISSILTSAFAPELAAAASSNKKQQQKANKPPVATINVLLTFDKHGVSNHPNHRSLYHGAVHFLRTLMKDKAGFSCPITLYTLSTTTLLRKYMGIFDAPVTMFRGALHTLFSGGGGGKKKSSKKDDLPGQLLFVNSVPEYLTAQSAMVNAHRSQMVWFRWGWISIGRYMIVNDLRKERI